MNSIYEDSPLGKTYDSSERENGKDFPSRAHTMIGKKRLDNLQFCMEEILKNQVPGDFIETGVWRGGATIFMRGFLKAYKNKTRKVWVADSFEGLPPPNANYPADSIDFSQIDFLKISEQEVQNNFKKYELLDEQVIFLKGFFADTLPQAPIEQIALLRLDGDMYQSTMDALVNLYPKVSIGGYIIIDDYDLPFCSMAVEDYRAEHQITDPLQVIDWTGVFWQRTK
ncbi:TylF/MycF family methyltransferase [Parachlamydia sp. C2]|uniref:TylF/MycF family methyltransferase n=1 Tax=Candidatus Protochlamydia phocaeensis TaxID=1414722 RepID=UPI0008382FB4